MANGKELVGTWAVNCNGSRGGMTILDAVDDGDVVLRVGFTDVARPDNWDGTWHPGQREIVLTRHLPGGATQTYQGYLGDNHRDLLMFGGSFTQSDANGVQFGWFAERLAQID